LVGAGLGGIVGYQDKRPATGERVGQKALMGAAIGYGAGSGMSALGSGGTGWSLGLGSGAGAGSGSSSTAGVNGLTSAPKAGGMSWGSIAKLGLGNAMQNQGNQMQGQDDELQRQQFLQRLMLLKQAQADRLRKIYGGA
jgi:hypothetical protein